MKAIRFCIPLLLLLSQTAIASPAVKRWTIRGDVNVGTWGVKFDSDQSGTTLFPIVLGELVVAHNTRYVSFEYGIGGPIFAHSVGARVRLLPSGGPFLGANYLINFGGANVAHFVRGNLGYEYVASGGFTILTSFGGFAVIRDFKDGGADKLGFLVRIGLGYSF